jgi:hypothetical protein
MAAATDSDTLSFALLTSRRTLVAMDGVAVSVEGAKMGDIGTRREAESTARDIASKRSVVVLTISDRFSSAAR